MKEASVSQNKRRILVVESDPETLNLVETLLTRVGVDCIATQNAKDAARILIEPPLPDLVIIDLTLSDVSGVEFVRQLRAKAAFDSLPVLVLAEIADPEQIRAALDVGADRYLTKPYIANNLLTVASEVLRDGRRR
ncbi:response regulator [Anaerolineae bacterium CFX9]|jgi:two-component system phosphate regulon response regulator PhoB|nr:response regulator [Anaerolineae bacterium CFX9]